MMSDLIMPCQNTVWFGLSFVVVSQSWELRILNFIKVV